MAESARDTTPPQFGWTPIPDPTKLTADLVEKAREDIHREMDFLRTRLEQKADFVQQLLSQRLDAIDTATVLLQDWRETLPRRLNEALTAYQNVVEQRFQVIMEKFQTITIQFEERDTRARGDAVATKTAVDAAFQAQRDMVAAQNANIAQALSRIELQSQKQIEQLVTLLQTTTGSTNDKVDDLKERLTLIEGRTAGITAAGTTQLATQQVSQGASGNVLAFVAIGLTLLGMIITIVVTIILNR